MRVAAATIPALVGATSHARADVTLTDESGRTAYLFGAFQYDPGTQPYYETLAIYVVLVFVACYVGPAVVRAGCRKSAVLRETLVWRQLDPRVLEVHRKTASERATVAALATTGGARAVDAAMSAVRVGLRAVGVSEAGSSSNAVKGAAPEMV